MHFLDIYREHVGTTVREHIDALDRSRHRVSKSAKGAMTLNQISSRCFAVAPALPDVAAFEGRL